MALFHQLYSESITSKDKELIVNNGISQFLDLELREKWVTILSSQHDVNRTLSIEKTPSTLSPFKFLLGLAASLLLVFGSMHIFKTGLKTDMQYAEQLLQETKIQHPGVTKGSVASDQQARILAVHSFDNEDFANASIHFDQINDKTDEDMFYLSVSYLYSDKIEEAKQLLMTLYDNSSQYRQECNWYLLLASILDNNQKEAKVIFSKINPSDWNYDKAQKLMD